MLFDMMRRELNRSLLMPSCTSCMLHGPAGCMCLKTSLAELQDDFSAAAGSFGVPAPVEQHSHESMCVSSPAVKDLTTR